MRNSIRTMFVVLAVLMSFTIVQAQEMTHEGQVACSVVVDGVVTAITETGAITVAGTIDYNTNNNVTVVDDNITVYGVPLDKEYVDVDDEVIFNVYRTPDDNLIACFLLTVNGESVEIVLRRSTR